MAETVVIAKCIGCGSKREIKPKEIAEGEQPMCSICFMPMIAEKAINRKQDYNSRVD